jgi:hypothetical protein
MNITDNMIYVPLRQSGINHVEDSPDDAALIRAQFNDALTARRQPDAHVGEHTFDAEIAECGSTPLKMDDFQLLLAICDVPCR